MELWLRYDLRSPPFAPSSKDLIAAALDQVAWADAQGFHTIQLGEHHGSEDGYNPSPLILGAGIAARTSKVRIHPVLLLPLHDPVRLGEDLCLLDNLSDGRVDITIGAGYVPSEFAMYGVSIHDRGRLLDAKLAVLHAIFEGRPFDYEGRTGRVMPLPVQPGGPDVIVGGSVMASARRAARLGDGYYPMDQSPEFIAEYKRACAELGKEPGRIVKGGNARYIHVTHDPDRDWARIAPHAMHETNAYAEAAKAMGQLTPFKEFHDPAELRKTNAYLVLTPQQCIDYMRSERDQGNYVVIPPLVGGLPPALSWESLDLLAREVLPVLRADEETGG